MPLAVVLNLDAEDELARGARWTPSAVMRARMERIAASIALPAGAVRVIEGTRLDASYEGRAWCPTPRALASLERCGARIAPHPSFEVLRRVNERGFARELASLDPEHDLGATLRATDSVAVRAHVAHAGPTGAWRLKRAFGVAGRGQRDVRAGVIGQSDVAWIEASLRLGALYVEPRAQIVRELSVHGWATSGRTFVRTVREQRIEHGSFVSSHALAPDALQRAHRRALIETAERVGDALIAAGYEGPFGIDAYVHRVEGGEQLRALSEINARYCMAWDDEDGWLPPSEARACDPDARPERTT